MQIIQLPAFDDNYLYLIESEGVVAAVDPGDPKVIIQELEKRNWTLDYILNTHHHWDHTNGNLALQKKYNAKIIGPLYDKKRIPGIYRMVEDGEKVRIGAVAFEVMFTPGHTRGHILFWSIADKVLFAGDTLFNLGCGRMFEGNQEQMWESMKNIRELPDDTLVYCAHEYTMANAKFALDCDPGNAILVGYSKELEKLRNAGTPTVPFLLGTNKMANPFLRADENELAFNMRREGADPAEVFGALRLKKDNF